MRNQSSVEEFDEGYTGYILTTQKKTMAFINAFFDSGTKAPVVCIAPGEPQAYIDHAGGNKQSITKRFRPNAIALPIVNQGGHVKVVQCMSFQFTIGYCK